VRRRFNKSFISEQLKKLIKVSGTKAILIIYLTNIVKYLTQNKLSVNVTVYSTRVVYSGRNIKFSGPKVHMFYPYTCSTLTKVQDKKIKITNKFVKMGQALIDPRIKPSYIHLPFEVVQRKEEYSFFILGKINSFFNVDSLNKIKIKNVDDFFGDNCLDLEELSYQDRQTIIEI